MISLIYLLEGIVIGFMMAVPIGAVGILCIRRTLNGGRRPGYITGLAGASADLVFSTISAFGIKMISDFITAHQYKIRIIGGVLLVLMGILLNRSLRTTHTNRASGLEVTGTYLSTLILALTNPLVMFGYAAVISTIEIAKLFEDYLSISMLISGIFLGSLLWFLTISNLALRFRANVSEEKLTIVNRVAGALLIIIGLTAIFGGMKGIY